MNPPEVSRRVVFLDDYDFASAPRCSRLRRLGQRPAPAAGGQRHERDEVGDQRGSPARGARRLVAGGLRRYERLGHQRRGRPRPRRPGLAPRRRADRLLADEVVPMFYDRDSPASPGLARRCAPPAHLRPEVRRRAHGRGLRAPDLPAGERRRPRWSRATLAADRRIRGGNDRGTKLLCACALALARAPRRLPRPTSSRNAIRWRRPEPTCTPGRRRRAPRSGAVAWSASRARPDARGDAQHRARTGPARRSRRRSPCTSTSSPTGRPERSPTRRSPARSRS